MMKLFMATAACLMVANVGGAQVIPEPPHGSVLFPVGGSTYYYNPGFADADLLTPGGSGEGAFSFWWNSGTVPGRNQLSQVVWAGNVVPFFSISFYNAFGVVGLANGMHLRFVLTDGGNNSCTEVSDEVMSFSSSWNQPITLTWNTNAVPYQFFASYGRAIIHWNAATSLCIGAGTPFKTPYPMAEWAVGASLTGGNPSSFYTGSLAEVFGHFQDGDYAIIRVPGTNRGYQATIDAGGANPIPLGLGTNCVNVFGLNLEANLRLPALCMRGGAAHFGTNQGGDSTFTIPIGFPPTLDGVTDPFDYR